MEILTCDTRGCKGKPHFIEYYEYDETSIYCRNHGNMQILKQKRQKVKYLKRAIKTKQKYLKCQNSKTGHQFPPPPESIKKDKDGEYNFNLTTIDFMNGTPHKCIKCGFTYWDGGIMNVSKLEINAGSILKQIPVEKLTVRLPNDQEIAWRDSKRKTCI